MSSSLDHCVIMPKPYMILAELDDESTYSAFHEKCISAVVRVVHSDVYVCNYNVLIGAHLKVLLYTCFSYGNFNLYDDIKRLK